MGTKMAEITKNGELKIKGNINTRLPAVVDGLVAHFPFDGTDKSSIPITILEDYKCQSEFIYTGTGYGIYSKMFYFDNFIKNYGININSEEEGYWIYATAEMRVDQVRKNLGGSIRMYFWHATPTDGWEASTSAGVSNTEWTKIGIKIKLNNYTPDSKGNPPDRIGFGIYNYPSAIDGGESCFRNLTVFLDKINSPYKNIIGVSPSTNTNCTLTEDGIAIENSTTNLIINGNFKNEMSGWSSWQAYGNTLQNKIIYDPKFEKILRLNMDCGTASVGITPNINIINDSIYTISYYVRIVKKSISYNYIYYTTYDTSNVKNSGYIPVSNNLNCNLIGEWQHVYRTFTAIADGKLNIRARIHSGEGDYVYGVCDFANIQIEKKDFPTSFTESTRGTGRIDIPFSLLPPYTINLKHLPKKTLDLVTDQGSSPMIFQMNNYHSNASISFWNFIKSLHIYIKGNTSSSWTTSKTYYTYTEETWNNKEHMYTLVAVDNRTFKVYMDGEYLGSQTSSEDVTKITYLSMGNAYQTNALYKDLSIYDRALTDDEIKKLSSSKFNLQTNGDLITNQIISKPTLPDDVYYFPLGCKTSDEFNNLEPTTEDNIAYEDGFLWVGQTTENVASGNLIYYTSYNILLERTNQDLTLQMVSDNRYLTIHNGIDYNGNIISLSGYIFKNGEPYTLPGNRANTYHTIPAIKWNFDKYTGHFEIVENCNATSSWLFHTPTGCLTDDIITIRDFQVEVKSYSSPITLLTRPETKLSYNKPDFIDFNEGTIACWFKPTEGFFNQSSWNRVFGHSTSTNRNEIQVKRNYTNNNLVMSISNNAGSPQSSWSSCPSANIEADKLYFVVARWSISEEKMSLTVNGVKKEQIWTSSHQPTVKGTFEIGYHKHANRNSNSFYRDLMVAKRSLTDEEISDIYNKKLIINTDNTLQIQNSITTEEVM